MSRRFQLSLDQRCFRWFVAVTTAALLATGGIVAPFNAPIGIGLIIGAEIWLIAAIWLWRIASKVASS